MRHPIAFIAATILALAIPTQATVVQAQGGGSDASSRSDSDRDDVGQRGRRSGRRGDRRYGDQRRRDNRENDQPASSEPATAGELKSTSSSTSGFGTTGGRDDRAAGIRKWATDIVKRNDKNGNMMLEPDEQADLGSSTSGADQNGDHVITIDEIVIHVSPKPAAASSSPKPAASSRPAHSHRGDSDRERPNVEARVVKPDDAKKSYRFRSTKDRQPSWRFSGKDANGDGQVSMSEYASRWTDRTAAEFLRYDRDNDGMITPDEVR